MNQLVALTGTQRLPTKQERRDVVLQIEDIIGQLQAVDTPVSHGFAPGVYARKVYIPAGVALTGKIHKYAHWNIILRGRIRIVTEQGLKEIVAPAMFVSPPGTKRAGLAIEDTEWVTLHPTNETDLDKIEKEVVVDTYAQLQLLTVEGEIIQ